MSAGVEQQVRRSAIEANSHRIPRFGLQVANIDGVLEDMSSEKQLPPPLTPPHKERFQSEVDQIYIEIQYLALPLDPDRAKKLPIGSRKPASQNAASSRALRTMTGYGTGQRDAAGWYDRFEPNSGRRWMSQKCHMRTTPPAASAAKSPMSFLGPGTSI
jgi:hypothetical protein